MDKAIGDKLDTLQAFIDTMTSNNENQKKLDASLAAAKSSGQSG